MIVMGLKGGSWVGDMYQKFEDMCAEVEEALYEDTFKYVENLHSVGETVKKIYSDVVQDFLPPLPSDPVEGEDSLSSVGHQDEVKLKVDNENGSGKSLEDIGVASSHEDSLNYVSYCSPKFSVIKPCKPKSFNASVEKCAKVNSQSQGTDLVLSNQAPCDTKHLNCSKDSEQECPSDLPSIDDSITNSFSEVASIVPRNKSDESTSVQYETSSMEVPAVSHNEDDGLGICRDLIECYGDGDVVKVKERRFLSDGQMTTDLNGHLSTDLSMMEADLSASLAITVENTIEVDKELSTFDIETSCPFLATKFRKCEADEGFLVEQLNEVKLGESCVLVEKNVKFSQSGLISLEKSYKKKIQDMLSPKRWSKSKQDQEQLTTWYEEQCETNTVSTMMQAELRKSLVSKSIESDWELL